MLAYGKDLFYTHLLPENSFDRLTDEFNYVAVLGTVAVVSIATVVLKYYNKSRKNLQVFKNT